ncbi:MAG: biopolymer transporter ExbD [Luteolibacter sp.]
MAGGGGGGDGEPEFQIAPMIDVLLVLLVFFVTITSTEVLKVDKNLTLPVSPNAQARDPEQNRNEFAVNVRYDAASNKGILVIDDRILDNWQDLVPILEARYEANSKLRAIVRGDKDLPAIEIQRIMGVIAESGVSDIAFSASNK